MSQPEQNSRPRVIVAGEHFQSILPYLREAAPGFDAAMVAECDLANHLADADVLVPTMVRIGEATLAGAPRLRLVHQWGAGLEGVDIAAATRRGIAVANVPTAGTGNAESVAEWCVMAAICLGRSYPQVQHQVHQGGAWGVPVGVSLLGKTAGIVGLGGIGRALAERLRPFGMRLLGLRRTPDEALRRQLGLEWLGGMDELPILLGRCDYLFLCTPLMPETRDLIDGVAFRAMKPGAFLVNPARGGIVSEPALLEALDAGRLGGAALDVFWQEPVRSDHPAVHHPRVLCTPHIAGVTDVSYRNIASSLVANIERVMAGQLPENCANPAVQPWFRAKPT